MNVPDPIARNPLDIDGEKEDVQTPRIGRHHSDSEPETGMEKAVSMMIGEGNDRSDHNSIPPDSRASMSNRPWTMSSPGRTVQSPMELLLSVLRYKWTMVLVFILVSAPMIAAIWTQIIPKYSARAEIRVRPIIPRLVFRTEESGPIPFYDSFVNTQVSIIRSLTVLQRVLDQEQVQQTRWYKDPPASLMDKLRGNTIPPMERLRDSLSVRPRPRTEIIDVSFLDRSASEAKMIVDAVLDQYMRYTAERSDATSDQLHRQLLNQYQTLEKEIQGREIALAELHKTLGTETPQNLISSKRMQLDGIQTRLGWLQQTIAVLEWEIAQVAGADANDVGTVVVGEAKEQPPYHDDAEWRKLDLNVRTLEHQIEGSLYAANNPQRKKMEKDLAFAKELRQTREEQLDERWERQPQERISLPQTATAMTGLGYGADASHLEFQLARTRREEQLLQEELATQQAEFKTLFETAQLLQKESNTLQQRRELFDAVRERLDQKNMERNVPGAINVLMRAYSPSKPASDRRMVFTAMALFAGLGMGGGVAFLRSTRNQSIYTPKDMPQPVQIPFLGSVPLVRANSLPGKGLFEEINQNRIALVESVRLVRTTLLSRLNARGATTILITSAAAGTGKSSLTRILAKSMAQAGKKVLMIDADLHKLTLSKCFNLLDEPGFMDSLAQRTVDAEHVHATDTPGLSIMPAGRRDGTKGEAFEEISNGAFRACVGQLAEWYNYDIILLDSPPLLAVADSSILAGQVDGTIMVERESLSQRTNVADALARLAATGGRLLGTVFVGSGGQGHHGYAYNYYQRSNEP